jgi:hypothetical protein
VPGEVKISILYGTGIANAPAAIPNLRQRYTFKVRRREEILRPNEGQYRFTEMPSEYIPTILYLKIQNTKVT